MSSQETPLQAVKRLYGNKEKLVDTLVASLRKDDSDDLKERLLKSSNKKLLRLVDASKTVTDKHGSTDQLAEVIAVAKGKGKDRDFIERLQRCSPPQLLDLASSAQKARS